MIKKRGAVYRRVYCNGKMERTDGTVYDWPLRQDQLSKMVNYISFALLILTLFTHSMLLYILAVAGIIYSYYRAFSRNISKRYSENQAYLKVKYDVIKTVQSVEDAYKGQQDPPHF